MQNLQVERLNKKTFGRGVRVALLAFIVALVRNHLIL